MFGIQVFKVTSFEVFSIVRNSDNWNFCCSIVEDLNMAEKFVLSKFQNAGCIVKDAFNKQFWVGCRTISAHWFEALSVSIHGKNVIMLREIVVITKRLLVGDTANSSVCVQFCL
jgi:hypothetical protein